MKFKILFLLLLGKTMIFAQEFSGKVINESTKEPVPYASVYFVELELGARTNDNGTFTIIGEFADSALIRVRALGYEDLYVRKSDEQTVFALTETYLKLPEVSVSSPLSTTQNDNVAYIDTRKLDDLNVIPGTIGDALANIPGVYQSSAGVGISKPVIRGMQGVRVLTMLNGLRIENQQWSGDHGNVFTSLGIGSVEIIKGPASLMFGADALGGTVYYVDRPYIAQGNQKIRVETRYETVNQGITSNATYQVAKNNWRFQAAGLYSNNADYQLPSGQYALFSRFSEMGGKMAFGYNKKKWLLNVRYAFAQNLIGIPGHTHDSIIDPAKFQVDNQGRGRLMPIAITPVQVNSNHILSVENKWLTDNGQVSLLVGHTFNQLREFEEKVTVPALNTILNNSLYHLKWTVNKKLGSSDLRIVSGLQGGFQMNRNGTGWEDDLIPDFNQLDNGVYSLVSLKKNRWRSMVGLRYDLRSLSVFNSELAGDFNRLYQSLNGSAGVVYSDTTNVLRLNGSTGFRSPHVAELTAQGAHHGSLRYEIGDIDLIPERGFQFDVTYELNRKHISFIVNPFFNYIQNYITISPIDSTADGLPVFNYVQFDEAQLYGGDIGIHYHPHFAHWLHIESSYSHIVSSDGNGGYLPLIPQNRVVSSLRFHLDEISWKKFKLKDLSIQHRFFNEQRQVALLETASDSYNLVNVGLNMMWDWNTPLELGIGVKNLLNESYIDHLSRLKNIELQHPGRSIYVRLAWDLTISNK
jgi:iron complex outermembrane receptor protein